MLMREVLNRYNELAAKRADLDGEDLTVAENNEYGDCEIALGMRAASDKFRSDAARRCELAHAARGSK